MSRSTVLYCALSILVASHAMAADWPGWRGQKRDGASRETGLLREWPEGGPVLMWKNNLLGTGFSSTAVVGDRIYTMGNGSKREWVTAFDAETGKQIWATAIALIEHTGDGPNSGPRSTPFIDGERLYTLGINGDLICLNTADGKGVWRKHLVKDFGGKIPQYGYSESVLVDGSNLLCTPGGEDATMIALNKESGEVIWKCQAGDEAAYSSIITYKGTGQTHYVTLTAGGAIGVNAADGKLLWRFKGLAGNAQMVNIPTCLTWGRTIFGTNGSAGAACFWWQPSDGPEAKQIYLIKQAKNFMGGFVLLSFGKDTYVFGCADPGFLACLDYKKGNAKWSERKPGKSSIIYADGMLYCRNENGPVYLVQATPSAFKLKGTLEQPSRTEKKTYTPPVIANGRLYLRDQWRLFCYDLTGKAKPPAAEPVAKPPAETPAARKPVTRKPVTRKPVTRKPVEKPAQATTPKSTPKFRARGTSPPKRPN